MTTNSTLTNQRVLVIDDEPDLRTLYEFSLARDGYEVHTAENVTQALELLRTQSFDAVITDMRLPDGLGLDIVKFLSQERRTERCVVITAYGSTENAVEALKAGAFDYLTKPVDLKQFRSVIAQATRFPQATHESLLQVSNPSLSIQASKPTTALLQPSLAANEALGRLVGSSACMGAVRERIQKVARSMAPVLVRGESGTGKELVARALHACSHRASGPFVAVNCGAIPENLLEAEFFGARKGAYTGAIQDRLGYFQAAHGGTLFLDEIGDLPLPMQAKLLRAIQERSVRPLGSSQEEQIDARILSATHHDLVSSVAGGTFRQDLYYRLNVIEITLPALRDRSADLPELAHALLSRICQESAQPPKRISELMMETLQSLPLHGNVRELENLIHRALALAEPEETELHMALESIASPAVKDMQPLSSAMVNLELPPISETSKPSLAAVPDDLQGHLDAQERSILLRALTESGFNRTAAAARLGMSLRQIRYRMVRLGIDALHEKSHPDNEAVL